MPVRRQSIISAVHATAAREGFALDTHQQELVERLAELHARPANRSRQSRGLYIHGSAGRGKSWIADAFFQAVPTSATARVHFHGFLNDVHRYIHEHRDDREALRRSFDLAVGGSRLLFFDELHVHDPGDGRILTRLLEYVVDHEITVVATSNYEPATLLPNPVWHHIFEPGIALIKRHFDVFHLDGTTDYRTLDHRATSGFAAGEWTTQGASPEPSDSTVLVVRDRRFRVRSAGRGRLCATFTQLCETPVSTIEYLEWAKTYTRWEIVDLPRLDRTNPEAQQRFINLIDILVESDVRVTFVSPHTLHEFLDAAPHRPDAFRMTSRMHLLRSPD